MNYTREAIPYLERQLESYVKEGNDSFAALIKGVLHILRTAPKFYLPDNGLSMGGQGIESLDVENGFRLPYTHMVMEYEMKLRGNGKIIVALVGEGKVINAHIIVNYTKEGEQVWGMTNLAASMIAEANAEGEWGIRCVVMDMLHKKIVEGYETMVPIIVAPLMDFLSALSCHNVSISKLPPTKPLAKKQKRRGVLPFDEYHVLTVGDVRLGASSGNKRDGRSPREHLRRGHIRTLESGKRVWVQSTIVNAGTAGRVSKDYIVRPK